MPLADRAGGVALLLLALGLAWESRALPFGSVERPGPGYFPILLAAALGAVGLFITLRPDLSLRLDLGGRREWGHAAAILAACAFSALALEALGYRLTVALIVATLLALLERRGVAFSLAFGLLSAILTFWLFNDVLKVLLPRGPGGL